MLDTGWTPEIAGIILEALRQKVELRVRRLIDSLLWIDPDAQYLAYQETPMKADIDFDGEGGKCDGK